MAPKVHTIKKPVVKAGKDTDELTIAKTVTLDQVEDDALEEATGADSESGVDNSDEFDLESETTTSDKPANLDDVDDLEEDLSMLDEDETGGDRNTGADTEEQPEAGYLEIYQPECLECRELVPFAKKTYKRKGCHFSSGNKNCPAESATIVVRVPLEEIVPRFLAAEKSRDFNRLSRLATKLAEKPDWYQQRVAQALEKARQNNN